MIFCAQWSMKMSCYKIYDFLPLLKKVYMRIVKLYSTIC